MALRLSESVSVGLQSVRDLTVGPDSRLWVRRERRTCSVDDRRAVAVGFGNVQQKFPVCVASAPLLPAESCRHKRSFCRQYRVGARFGPEITDLGSPRLGTLDLKTAVSSNAQSTVGVLEGNLESVSAVGNEPIECVRIDRLVQRREAGWTRIRLIGEFENEPRTDFCYWLPGDRRCRRWLGIGACSICH